MDPKNFVVILLAFCTTLLLGFGVCIVFGAIGVDVCKEGYCYVIRDFIQFYRTVFLTFGVCLTIIAIFGFMGLVLKNKKILTFYARSLILTLLSVLIILCAGIWAKGPVQLRSSLFVALRTYGNSCRLMASVDQLQTQFKCCGIDRPEDWSYIYNTSNIEPPMSCCDVNLVNLVYEQLDQNGRCLISYSKGCLGPLRQVFWRIFNIVVLLAAVIALKSTVAIICTYKIINNLGLVPSHMHSQQNLISSAATAPMDIVYYPEDHFIKKVPSSTAV